MSSLPTFNPRAKQLADYANDFGQAFKDFQPLDGERVADVHRQILDFAAGLEPPAAARWHAAAAIVRELFHPDDWTGADRQQLADELQATIYDAAFLTSAD